MFFVETKSFLNKMHVVGGQLVCLGLKRVILGFSLFLERYRRPDLGAVVARFISSDQGLESVRLFE
jgi:hypothetical protein